MKQNTLNFCAFSETPSVSMAGTGRTNNRIWREARRVLIAQSALGMLATCIAVAVWGWTTGGWALMGALVCVGPTALLAVRLNVAARPGGNFGAALLAGELLKVGLVVALLMLAYALSGKTHSLAVLLGFIAAVQGHFFALIFTDR